MNKKILIVVAIILALIVIASVYMHYTPLIVSIVTTLVALASFVGGWMANKHWPHGS